MRELVITQPDDMHLHVRTGEMTRLVAPMSAREMGRAVIMPNLVPPVRDPQRAASYKEEVLEAVRAKDPKSPFEPLMALYLTDRTDRNLVMEAKKAGIIGFKLYPLGATTNSEFGVSDLLSLMPTLEAMREVGMPLLAHGEVTAPEVDIFDREKAFIDRVMSKVVRELPGLKVVFEHITTKDAADFVLEADENVGATITPQHLLYNRNKLLVGGVKPHYYCLPILKAERHREALVKAATGEGSKKFFLGTDSAPHERGKKECSCGCAGSFSADAAIEIYAGIFEEAGHLDKLEAFASFNGADFYGIPRNTRKIRLVKESWTVPESYPYEGGELVPLMAGQELAWKFAGFAD